MNPAGALRRLPLLGAIVLAAVGLAACETGAYPLDIFPEMHYQQSFRVAEPPAVPIPEGQVPVDGVEPELSDFAQALALENPVGFTGSVLEAGAKLFRTNCAMCHGVNADGSSFVATRFSDAGEKPPPSLRRESVKVAPDGSLFWTVTNGVNRMPPFKRLLTADERWTIIAYLRSLQ